MVKPGALDGLGIHTVADLIHHLPRRHEDRRKLKPIGDLRDGEVAIVHGTIEKVRSARLRGRKSYVEASVTDGTGVVELVDAIEARTVARDDAARAERAIARTRRLVAEAAAKALRARIRTSADFDALCSKVQAGEIDAASAAQTLIEALGKK